MRVVDTSAWIEWIGGSELGDRVREHFPGSPDWIVPTMVQLELVKWATRVLDPGRAAEILALTQTLVVVPLNTQIAVRAANLFTIARLPTADAIIYATALDNGADLLTCDALFEGLDQVIYIAKASSAG
jgi:predicted nucleic acid-binding protein